MEFIEVRDPSNVMHLLACTGDLNPNIEIRVCFALVKKGLSYETKLVSSFLIFTLEVASGLRDLFRYSVRTLMLIACGIHP